jgi:hypothetical protein
MGVFGWRECRCKKTVNRTYGKIHTPTSTLTLTPTLTHSYSFLNQRRVRVGVGERVRVRELRGRRPQHDDRIQHPADW